MSALPNEYARIWRNYIHQEIARALKEIGVVGTTIDGSHVGGIITAGAYIVDNIQGFPIVEIAEGAEPETGAVPVYDGDEFQLQPIPGLSGPWAGGMLEPEPVYYDGEPVEYGGEEVVYGQWVTFVTVDGTPADGDAIVWDETTGTHIYEAIAADMDEPFARSWMGL